MENKYYTPESQEEVIRYILSEKKIYMKFEDDIKGNLALKFDNDRLFLQHLISFIELNDKEQNTLNRDEYFRFINPSLYEIPYLAKEDIEECGFVHLKEDGDLLNFQKIVDDYSFYEIDYDLDEQLLTIEYYYQPEMVAEVTGHVNSAIRFKGTIKNKSELKQILKIIL